MKYISLTSFSVMFILIIALPVQALGQIPIESPDWTLELEKEGIEIYTKPQPGSDFEAFKAVAVLDSPLENVMAVMANPQSCEEWVHGCVKSEGFDEKNFNKRYAHSVNDLPWPVKDRDYVLEINTSHDPKNNRIVMEMFAVADRLPEKEDFVRVNVQETHYYFMRSGEDKTKMIWLQHTEPAGAIPSWLVNALIVDIPFKSMKKLEEVANSAKYQDAKLIFDADGNIRGVERNQK